MSEVALPNSAPTISSEDGFSFPEETVAGFPVRLTLDGGSRPPFSCIMIGIEQGSVLLDCAEPIDPGNDVILTFDRISLRGSVRYSRPRRSRHRVSVGIDGSEHSEERTAPRFPMDEPGALMALGDDGTVVLECRLTDFSRSGLGLRSPQEVAVGTMICIETSSILVAGSVRRCLPFGDGVTWQVGVAVTDVLTDDGTKRTSGWSFARFRLRLAEIILGREIETERRRIYVSGRRR